MKLAVSLNKNEQQNGIKFNCEPVLPHKHRVQFDDKNATRQPAKHINKLEEKTTELLLCNNYRNSISVVHIRSVSLPSVSATYPVPIVPLDEIVGAQAVSRSYTIQHILYVFHTQTVYVAVVVVFHCLFVHNSTHTMCLYSVFMLARIHFPLSACHYFIFDCCLTFRLTVLSSSPSLGMSGEEESSGQTPKLSLKR